MHIPTSLCSTQSLRHEEWVAADAGEEKTGRFFVDITPRSRWDRWFLVVGLPFATVSLSPEGGGGTEWTGEVCVKLVEVEPEFGAACVAASEKKRGLCREHGSGCACGEVPLMEAVNVTLRSGGERVEGGVMWKCGTEMREVVGTGRRLLVAVEYRVKGGGSLVVQGRAGSRIVVHWLCARRAIYYPFRRVLQKMQKKRGGDAGFYIERKEDGPEQGNCE
jgi:hypothetical protein